MPPIIIIKQRIVAAPIEHASKAQEYVRSQSKEDTDFAIRPFRNSVLLAFQKTVNHDENVYIKTSPPSKFTVSTTSPGVDYVIVEKEFLEVKDTPHIAEMLGESEKKKISENIIKWAKKHGIDVSTLLFKGKLTEKTKPEYKTALTRLLESQPEHIRQDVVIPLDIAEFLSRKV